MELLYDTYKLLRAIQANHSDRFSGIGLVVYDENTFDNDNHCDLRPDIMCPNYHITDKEICRYLNQICSYEHALHDGFHMFNSRGYLNHVAQYFVPPLVKGLKPNLDHGVRLYSSLCGSLMKGVLFIGMISSNYKIYIFQNGKYVETDKLEVILSNEYQESVI